MLLVAPLIYELFAAAVQIFHGCEFVSFDELLLYVVERTLDLAFLTWPVVWTRIQLEAHMLCQQHRVRVVYYLVLCLRIVFDDQRLRIVDQKLQRDAAKVLKQFLYGFVDRICILSERKADRLLP